MTRRLAAMVALAALMFLATAQADPNQVDPVPPPDTTPSIIPLPNSGVEPAREGDRGSATQYAVLVGTMGAMALIVVLVMRESKKKKSATQGSDRTEPDQANRGAGV